MFLVFRLVWYEGRSTTVVAVPIIEITLAPVVAQSIVVQLVMFVEGHKILGRFLRFTLLRFSSAPH